MLPAEKLRLRNRRDVEHRVVAAHLPADEHDPDRGADGEVDE